MHRVLITGAGGGGYMLLYCQFERKHRVADALMALGAVTIAATIMLKERSAAEEPAIDVEVAAASTSPVSS